MIQRIQSLWLFLAAAALMSVLLLPVGMFKMPHGLYECTAFTMTQAGDVPTQHLPVQLIGIGSILAAILSFSAIFMYQKRRFQIRWIWVAFASKLLLTVGLAVLFGYFKYSQDSWVGYGPALLMPPLGMVLDYMAIKGVQKDEALVKSLDRIR